MRAQEVKHAWIFTENKVNRIFFLQSPGVPSDPFSLLTMEPEDLAVPKVPTIILNPENASILPCSSRNFTEKKVSRNCKTVYFIIDCKKKLIFIQLFNFLDNKNRIGISNFLPRYANSYFLTSANSYCWWLFGTPQKSTKSKICSYFKDLRRL